ncbi:MULTISPECIES: hypothetical protein [Acinetobacter]|nr:MULTISPECIES: hypothetical protein [Acinetobacter]
MGALEQFKQKMAEKRLLKELHLTLNEHCKPRIKPQNPKKKK